MSVYLRAFKFVFSRHCWKRIRVLQELTVAKGCLVLCSDKTIPKYVLIEAQEVMKLDQGPIVLALQPLEEDSYWQIRWEDPSLIEASSQDFLSKDLRLYGAINITIKSWHPVPMVKSLLGWD